MSSIEPNILNYTIVELMEILSIDELSEENVIKRSNSLINEANEDKKFHLVDFYKEVKEKLLEFIETFNREDQDGDGDGDESGKEEGSLDEYFYSEIKKGDLNPLENKTEKRFLVLDSQYLPVNIPKTNYVANLSEKLHRVINIKLHSYSIPFNWYLISSQKRNNIFYLIIDEDIKVSIIIEDGNYTIHSMVTKLNTKLKEALNIIYDTVFYNESTGKISIDLYNKTIENKGTITRIIFFDKNEPYLLSEEENIFSTLRSFKNLTLGWIIGFRSDEIILTENGNISDVIPDLKGPRYLYLVIDDFKRNHTTNNLITITKIDENISMPSYYNIHMPLDCNQETLTVLPSAPRTLTQAQIYTINEVMKNKNKNNYYSSSPNESDILAILPLKHNGLTIGDRIVETSGQLQDNKREYNGPVDLDRIGVKLIDDTGFIVDLNGSDWTLTVMYEYIYQM